VQARQQQVAQGGGLIQIERSRDLEGDLLEFRSEAALGRQRVDRVGLVDEHQRNPPAIHVGAEGFEGAVAFTTVEVGAEVDRGSDIPGDVIEQVDGGAKINGGAMLVPDPARYGKAGLGGGELARYSANHLGADTARFLRLLRGERRERPAKA